MPVRVVSRSAALRAAIRAAIAGETELRWRKPADSPDSLKNGAKASRQAELLIMEAESFVSAFESAQDKSLTVTSHTLCVGVAPSGSLLRRCFQMGARGFLRGDEPPEVMRYFLRSCVAGAVPVNPAILPCLLPPPRAGAGEMHLTCREAQMVQWLAEGLADKEIAEQAGITVHTVKKHLKNAYRKLQVRSRTEAMLKWMRRDSV